jgi:hypothetical protein
VQPGAQPRAAEAAANAGEVRFVVRSQVGGLMRRLLRRPVRGRLRLAQRKNSERPQTPNASPAPRAAGNVGSTNRLRAGNKEDLGLLNNLGALC